MKLLIRLQKPRRIKLMFQSNFLKKLICPLLSSKLTKKNQLWNNPSLNLLSFALKPQFQAKITLRRRVKSLNLKKLRQESNLRRRKQQQSSSKAPTAMLTNFTKMRLSNFQNLLISSLSLKKKFHNLKREFSTISLSVMAKINNTSLKLSSRPKL